MVGEVADGADVRQSGADVAQRGRHRADGRNDVVSAQAHGERRGSPYYEVYGDETGRRSHHRGACRIPALEYRDDGVRMDHPFQLRDRFLDDDLETHALDRSRGRTRAAADKHEGKQKELGEHRPQRVIRGDEAGRGYYADDLKRGVAQRRDKVVVCPVPDQDGADHQDGRDHDHGVEAELGVTVGPKRPSADGGEVEVEICA